MKDRTTAADVAVRDTPKAIAEAALRHSQDGEDRSATECERRERAEDAGLAALSGASGQT